MATCCVLAAVVGWGAEPSCYGHFLYAIYPARSGDSGSRCPHVARSGRRHREGWKRADQYDVSRRVSSDPGSGNLRRGWFSLKIHLRGAFGGWQQDRDAKGSDWHFDIRWHPRGLRRRILDNWAHYRALGGSCAAAGAGIGISAAARGGSSVSPIQ
jgi:hypothetical protein